MHSIKKKKIKNGMKESLKHFFNMITLIYYKGTCLVLVIIAVSLPKRAFQQKLNQINRNRMFV